MKTFLPNLTKLSQVDMFNIYIITTLKLYCQKIGYFKSKQTPTSNSRNCSYETQTFLIKKKVKPCNMFGTCQNRDFKTFC